MTPTGHVTPAPLPTAREALREGLVDGEHLDAIAKTLDQLPDTATIEDRELVESTLAVTARTSEPHVVRKHGEVLLAHLNADGPEPRDADPTQPVNSFRYQRTRDGGMKYAGRLGHQAGEELLAVLGPLAKPQSPLPGMPDPRSEAERNGDALADLIHGALTGGALPTRGGEKPHLNLVLDYNKLLEGLGSAAADGGSVFCPTAVRQHACDAELIPMVLNGDSVPLDLGRKRRLVTLAQRRALIARDKGCAFPGCHLPPRWTDAYHIRHWLDGGGTDLANLVLLCRRHHKLLHDSEWSIEVVAGIPWFQPPKWVDPGTEPRAQPPAPPPAVSPVQPPASLASHPTNPRVHPCANAHPPNPSPPCTLSHHPGARNRGGPPGLPPHGVPRCRGRLAVKGRGPIN
ncbi:MAG TPA: DUF222 domain-containing protein [Actinophytocola sp.]|uniref:HNH endonuclease signature motif containing protein n=1 Tax=Actinophytocola sp. TaxID=1872138 RepID=UPI002DDD02AA|nr:DUF222 domain-containing protein [Actinophytocola sp.]HEV2781184.1 DUF222 domain-containing protein [Actinophytocola sp.]